MRGAPYVCRQGTSILKIILIISALALGLAGCGSVQVLGIPRDEAAAMLGSGDLDFIRQAELPANFSRARTELKQLERIHPAAAFYAALQMGQSSSDRYLQTMLYSSALDSTSRPVRRESSAHLIPIILSSDNEWELNNLLSIFDENSLRVNEVLYSLRAASYYSLGRYNDVISLLEERQSSAWDKAMYLFASYIVNYENLRQRDEVERALAYFLFEDHDVNFLRWAITEIRNVQRKLPGNPLFHLHPLDGREIIALTARLRPTDYRNAADILNELLQANELLFFTHPSLIGDLGRAYQYTPAVIEEGREIFVAWVDALERPWLNMHLPSSDYIKYMVYFFAGRITRTMGRLEESLEYFNRALDFAPDTVQSDAVYWYMLMNAMTLDMDMAVRLALNTIPRWDNMATFSVILDSLASYLVRNRQWYTLLDFFTLLEHNNKSGLSLAQFAWITGRALEEGYIYHTRSPEVFFRISFEEARNSFYYRAMSAYKLGETLSALNDAAPRNISGTELEFLLGFYYYGASSFARSYINAAEDELEIFELRAISSAMADAGRLQESMNFTSRYLRRDDYVIHRDDLYLHYPHAFRDIIEQYADQYNIPFEVFFALIHTESHFMADVFSNVGAMGLSQLMPATAEDMADRLFRRGGPDYRNANFREPEINVHIGAFYLRHLTDLFGSPLLALLAYNGGQGRVRRWLNENDAGMGGALPQDLFLEAVEFTETREYGRRVLGAAAVYGYLYYGLSMVEIVADFMGRER